MKYFFDNAEKKNDWNVINIYKYTFNFYIIEKRLKWKKLKVSLMKGNYIIF